MPTLVLLVFACRAPTPTPVEVPQPPNIAELQVRFVVEDGTTPPTGQVRLLRRGYPESVDPTDPPAVLPADHGLYAFTDTPRLPVPEGFIAFDAIGFAPTGLCDSMFGDTGQFSCSDAEWYGLSEVAWVSERPIPDGLTTDHVVLPGEVGTVELLVREDCLCSD